MGGADSRGSPGAGWGVILAVAGALGSGKTRLSTAVAQQLGWSQGGFGDYVRAVALARGEPDTRAHLQVLGEALTQEGWPTFCAAVLQWARWIPGRDLVLDGVRHIEVLDTLRTVCAPDTVALVYLFVPAPVRGDRLARRDGLGPVDLKRAEAHSSETQGAQLRQRADLELDGTCAVEQLAAQVIDWHWGARHRD